MERLLALIPARTHTHTIRQSKAILGTEMPSSVRWENRFSVR